MVLLFPTMINAFILTSRNSHASFEYLKPTNVYLNAYENAHTARTIPSKVHTHKTHTQTRLHWHSLLTLSAAIGGMLLFIKTQSLTALKPRPLKSPMNPSQPRPLIQTTTISHCPIIMRPIQLRFNEWDVFCFFSVTMKCDSTCWHINKEHETNRNKIIIWH